MATMTERMAQARKANAESTRRYYGQTAIEAREILRDEIVRPGQGRRVNGTLASIDLPASVAEEIAEAILRGKVEGVAGSRSDGLWRWSSGLPIRTYDSKLA